MQTQLMDLLMSGNTTNFELAFTLAEGLGVDLLKKIKRDFKSYFTTMYGQPIAEVTKYHIYDIFTRSWINVVYEDLLFENISEQPPLPNIKSINFSRIGVKILPPLYKIFPNLEEIEIVRGKLEEIPQDLSEYKKLKIFCYDTYPYTSKNFNEKSISSAIFPNSLKELQLSNCKLKEIPSNILQHQGIEILELDYNDIGEIPEEISNMKRLTDFNISNNNITKIPQEIFELKHLKSINLGSNNISTLPKGEFESNTVKPKIDLTRNKNFVLPDWYDNIINKSYSVDRTFIVKHQINGREAITSGNIWG